VRPARNCRIVRAAASRSTLAGGALRSADGERESSSTRLLWWGGGGGVDGWECRVRRGQQAQAYRAARHPPCQWDVPLATLAVRSQQSGIGRPDWVSLDIQSRVVTKNSDHTRISPRAARSQVHGGSRRIIPDHQHHGEGAWRSAFARRAERTALFSYEVGKCAGAARSGPGLGATAQGSTVDSLTGSRRALYQ
jgi:hypothetical protein